MRLRQSGIIGIAVCAAIFQSSAAPQSDAETRAREYMQFLVQELDQWTRDFPQAYNMALVRPPVDAAGLSENAKAGAHNLRAAIVRLTELSRANDVRTNPAFHAQLEKAVAAAAPMNAALAAQKFPEAIQSDWQTIRTTLNSLAEICKTTELAIIEAPGPGSAPVKDAKTVAANIPAGAITGYVVDQRCALRGKAMWVNAQCVLTCVRDGDKVVLVSEDGKVMQISNQEKIEAESYGQKVAITGKTAGDVITVATLQIL